MVVSRRKQDTYDLLFSKQLCTYPYQKETIQLYKQFVKDHPEINEDELDMDVICTEREEDYYGNGGGVDREFRIVRYREETDEEVKKRVEKEEKEVYDQYLPKIEYAVKDIVEALTCFTHDKNEKKVYIDDIQKKINDFVSKTLKEYV